MLNKKTKVFSFIILLMFSLFTNAFSAEEQVTSLNLEKTPVTLQLRQLDLSEFMLIFSEKANMEIKVEKEEGRKRISAFFYNVNIEDAIFSIIEYSGYDLLKENNNHYILSKADENILDKVKTLNKEDINYNQIINKKFSNTDILEVFVFFNDEAKMNFIVDTLIRNRQVNINFENISANEALFQLLNQFNLKAFLYKNIIGIFPNNKK
ncbi:MAG: hypothetical protein KAI43_14640 [Candidatus Aureabacteria bacterium]|nr:hypothetical protein [Candidatus Auribacterota bacterium]